MWGFLDFGFWCLCWVRVGEYKYGIVGCYENFVVENVDVKVMVFVLYWSFCRGILFVDEGIVVMG